MTNSEFRSRLTGALIAAVPTPFSADGSVAMDSLERYIASMQSQDVGGVAVWAHTGRGLHLSNAQRRDTLKAWRAGLPDKLIVAGAGGKAEAKNDEEYVRSATAMAAQAAGLGADALLCYAPTRFRDLDSHDQTRQIVYYHESLAEIGKPLILFYLYEAAGGINYSRETLQALFKIDGVVGIKLATLNSVMTYQDVVREIDSSHHLVITGEDRFLGYSMMMGASAALIGMGAVCTSRQSQLLRSYLTGEFVRFQSESNAVDQLAQVLFRNPMEGYIKRVLHGLAALGVIDLADSNDPFGPTLTKDDLLEVEDAVKKYARD
jgi:4-hydroxy-tetrahydrodipicolinate synthase